MGLGNTTGIIGREVVGRRVGCSVEVNEGIADGVAEGVVDRAAALVPYGALVERNRVSGVPSCAWGGDASEKAPEREEER